MNILIINQGLNLFHLIKSELLDYMNVSFLHFAFLFKMSRKIIDIASLFTRSRSIQTCSTFGFTSTLSSSFNSLMPRNQRTYLTIKSDSIPSFKKCIGRSSSTLIPLIRYSRNYSSKPKIGLNIDKKPSNNISNPNPSSPKFSIKSIIERNRFTLKREDIYTIPNYLTLARLALSPLILYLITINAYTSALAVLSFAAVTDVLDGWIARTWKCGTALGSVLDPLADKVLMSVLVVGLSSVGLIPCKNSRLLIFFIFCLLI